MKTYEIKITKTDNSRYKIIYFYKPFFSSMSDLIDEAIKVGKKIEEDTEENWAIESIKRID
ncbi:MAG: hypothetical protein AABY22_00575 [Nanoarchaeota archaeon]